MSAVLVTGSSGFLGSRTMRTLVVHGYQALGIDRRPSAQSHKTFAVDIRDRDALLSLSSPASISGIIHLAGMHVIPECEADPVGTWETNVTATANVLAMAEALSVEAVVFASSADVYAPGTLPHAEDDALGSPNIYGRSKAAAEQLVLEWGKGGGRTAIVLRLFNLVGRGDENPHLVPQLLDQFRNSPVVRVGDLSTVRDYVLADDVAALCVTALRHNSDSLIMNVGNGIGITGIQVLKAISGRMTRERPIIQDESRLRKSDRPCLISDRTRLDELFRFPRRSLDALFSWVRP